MYLELNINNILCTHRPGRLLQGQTARSMYSLMRTFLSAWRWVSVFVQKKCCASTNADAVGMQHIKTERHAQESMKYMHNTLHLVSVMLNEFDKTLCLLRACFWMSGSSVTGGTNIHALLALLCKCSGMNTGTRRNSGTGSAVRLTATLYSLSHSMLTTSTGCCSCSTLGTQWHSCWTLWHR